MSVAGGRAASLVIAAAFGATACSGAASKPAGTVPSFEASLKACLDGVAVTLYGEKPGTVVATSTVRFGDTVALGAPADDVRLVRFRYTYADPAFDARVPRELESPGTHVSNATYRERDGRFAFERTDARTTFTLAGSVTSLAFIPQVTNRSGVLNAKLRAACPDVALGATT